MKQLIKIFPLLATLLFAVSAQADTKKSSYKDSKVDVTIINLLSGDNSTFNSGKGDWDTDNVKGGASASLSNENQSLKAVITRGEQSYQPQIILKSNVSIDNDTYYVKFRAKMASGQTGKLSFICQGDDYNNYQVEIQDIEITDNWTPYCASLGNLDNNFKKIMFNAGFKDGTYYLDDIEFGKAVPFSVPTFKKDLEESYNVIQGKHLTLEVAATGFPVPTYQWYYVNGNGNGTEIKGANSSSYTVPTETLGDFTYYCVATNTTGSTNSTTATVSVQEPTPVNGVSLDKTNATIEIESSTTLTATVTPNDAANKSVIWSSNNPGVATVSGGIVKAIAIGNATITVTTVDGRYTASCNVTVVADAGNWTETTDGLQYKVNSNELIIKGNSDMNDYTVSAGTVILANDFDSNKISLSNKNGGGINWSVFGTNDGMIAIKSENYTSDCAIKLHIVLPNGSTLSNFTDLKFDFCGGTGDITYKGIKIGIQEYENLGNFDTKNVSETQGEKSYSLSGLSNDIKALNEFDVYINPTFQNGTFYFDNFRLTGGQDICDQPWAKDKSTVTKVTVREGVTSIGNNAFNGFNNITEVDIPSTVQTIGSNAFTNRPTINFHSNPNTNTFGATRNLILVDSDKPYMSENPNQYNSIHYYRTATANYFTLVVPFNAEIPSGMKVYEMTGVNNPNAISFHIVQGGRFVENKPYLVWMENPTDFELTATTSPLTITPNVENNVQGDWTMTGAYVQKTIDAKATNCYAFSTSDNKLHKYTNTLNVAPFRCYFTSTTSSARMAVNFDDNLTTDIDECNNTEAVPTEVYNINGIRQNGMQQGLNIVRFSNGTIKKVIIK